MATITIRNPAPRKRNPPPPKANPRRGRRKTKRRAKRRNPAVTTIAEVQRRIIDNPRRGAPTAMVTQMVLPGALGFIATRSVPRLLLKNKDAGATGYAANVATAALAGGIAWLLKKRTIAKSIWAGGGIAIAARGVAQVFPAIAPGLGGLSEPSELDAPSSAPFGDYARKGGRSTPATVPVMMAAPAPAPRPVASLPAMRTAAPAPAPRPASAMVTPTNPSAKAAFLSRETFSPVRALTQTPVAVRAAASPGLSPGALRGGSMADATLGDYAKRNFFRG